ncbi:MAG: HEAT repeat domain-containing protein [Phycisphaerae bacterium]
MLETRIHRNRADGCAVAPAARGISKAGTPLRCAPVFSWRGHCVILCVLAWSCIGSGCQSDAKRREALNSSSPVVRSTAIVELEKQGDLNSVHALVGMLEDPDRAVRMYAILALRRMCGEDYGYRYYAPEPDRESSINAWRDALREGRVTVGGAREPSDDVADGETP